VWLRSNKTFVPALGTAHFDLRLARCGLSSLNRGWVGFHKQTIFEPGQPQRAMPAAFFFLDARLNGRDPERVARAPKHPEDRSVMPS
jgi:hypothetical protein